MFIMFKDKHHHAILIVLIRCIPFLWSSRAARSLISSPTKASNMAPKGNIQNSARPGTKIEMVPSKNSDVTIKVEQLVPHLYFLGHRKRGNIHLNHLWDVFFLE